MSDAPQTILRLQRERKTLSGLVTFTPDDDRALLKPSDLLRVGGKVYVIEGERDGDYHYRLATLRGFTSISGRRFAKVEWDDNGDDATVEFFRLRVVLNGL